MLAEIRAIGPDFFGVLGNNDMGLDLPHSLKLERGGHTFALIHIPPMRPGGADFLLHGHTHVPRDEGIGMTRVLNPGSVGLANKGAPASYAWLEIDGRTKQVSWRVVRA